MDLADILRCPAEHEESWLVVRVHAIDDRQLIDGTLGCPVCGAEYPVHDGVADFRAARDEAMSLPESEDPRPDSVLRAAALLGLSEGLRVVVLTGSACALASALGAFATLRAIALNPTVDMDLDEHVSVFLTDARLPLANASAHGAMTSADSSNVALSELVRVLKPKGRLVAPVETDAPSDLRELARDEREWVAERTAPPSSTPVQLKLSR